MVYFLGLVLIFHLRYLPKTEDYNLYKNQDLYFLHSLPRVFSYCRHTIISNIIVVIILLSLWNNMYRYNQIPYIIIPYMYNPINIFFFLTNVSSLILRIIFQSCTNIIKYYFFKFLFHFWFKQYKKTSITPVNTTMKTGCIWNTD